MESVDLQMEDIFGEDEGDEDLFTNHASIPDLPPDEGMGAEEGQNIDNDAVLARLRDLSKGAAKRTVKRVQPKLDPARLTGDRGIGVLPKVFKDVQFKGKGHEAEDLKKIMRYLEHWAHRLFPKMPFDEVLERIEKLGTKREVQTYIKRMRLDIPVEAEETAVVDDQEDIFDVSVNENKEEKSVSRIGDDEEEVIEELIREEEEQMRQSQVNHPTEATSHSTCPSSPVTPATPATPSASTSGGLTTEQLERIEANKRRAQERRLAKLGPNTPGTPASNAPSIQVHTPLVYPASPLVNTAATKPTSQESPSATAVPSGDNSVSPQGEPLQTDADQLNEDKLLADLEDDEDNTTGPDLSASKSQSAHPETQPPDSTPCDQMPTAVTSPDTLAVSGPLMAEQTESDKPSQEASFNMEDAESASLSILD